MKHEVLVVLDLDVALLDSTSASEAEKVTEKRVRLLIEGKRGLSIEAIIVKKK